MSHPSPHHDALVNADGSWKFTNALAKETSPYLLQHAHNPVDWMPWGPEAFHLAREQDKPIFLSVGYSTCYWCHVMERQCFENPDIAALMNKLFINIKVDREERPDVDDIYMTSVQLMTQRGGWPMSVFLTPPKAADENDPGLKPFYAGTYFPPRPMYQGMPSFPDLLERLHQAWTEDRAQIIEQADRVADAMREHLTSTDPVEESLSLKPVQNAANQLMRMYDSTHAGFGNAPKFPQPSNLLFLLAIHDNQPQDELAQVLHHTFDRMARGGMYDQIGGGFHRYSVDQQWLVPHFEKMLYDNGQLTEAMAKAVESNIPPDDATAQTLYHRVLRQTCDYVLREMTDESGALWSAQDAEVNAREGGSYLWTPQQFDDALDADSAKLARAMYGLDLGTNFQDPHHDDEPPSNVLFLPRPLPEFAIEHDLAIDALLERKQQIDETLLAVRDQREQPGDDDKVLVAWNGMMIAGLSRTARLLKEDRYTTAARQAVDAILQHMTTPAPEGQLLRSMRKGQAKIPAFLEDYAFFVHGLIELHQTTDDPVLLDHAKRLTQIAIDNFAVASGGGGYYDTLDGQQDLFVRVRSTYDGAVPSGNSQMVHNLLDLHALTRDKAYLERAATDLKSFGLALRQQGANMVHMQHALLRVLTLPEAADLLGDVTAEAPTASAVQPSTQRERQQALSVVVDPDQVALTDADQANTRVTLHIGPEFHLNANPASDANLIATQLTLENAPGLELDVAYPSGTQKQYTFADQPLAIYEDTVTFDLTIRKVGEVTPDARPTLMIHYQLCTEQSCLEPRTAELPLTITL